MQQLLLLPLVAALLSACVPLGADQRPGAAGDSSGLLRANRARAEAPQIDADQRQALTRGMRELAIELYQTNGRDSNDNFILSPYSISLAFSLIYAGARGETGTQLAEVLRFLPQQDHHSALNALDQQLAALGSQEDASAATHGTPLQLTIANATWGQQGFPFNAAYLDLLARHYGAGLHPVDFEQQPEQARGQINRWVAEQTQEHIAELFPRGSIAADTRLVLANAIYFKASWLYQFDSSRTSQAPFTLLDGSTVTADMMYNDAARIPYVAGDGYQAALMPYMGRSADMLLLLPAAGSFADVEQQLSSRFLAGLRDKLQEHDVKLHMPRFTFKSELDLKPLLGEMGLRLPFSGEADFSGIAEGGGLSISKALHSATISVDEQGTEATAATGVSMAVSAYPGAELNLDRPFMFAIIERQTGSLLFLGRVLNPAP